MSLDIPSFLSRVDKVLDTPGLDPGKAYIAAGSLAREFDTYSIGAESVLGSNMPPPPGYTEGIKGAYSQLKTLLANKLMKLARTSYQYKDGAGFVERSTVQEGLGGQLIDSEEQFNTPENIKILEQSSQNIANKEEQEIAKALLNYINSKKSDQKVTKSEARKVVLNLFENNPKKQKQIADAASGNNTEAPSVFIDTLFKSLTKILDPKIELLAAHESRTRTEWQASVKGLLQVGATT